MGFGPAWRVQGNEIIPLGGVDTLQLPSNGEFAHIKRSPSALSILAAPPGSGGAYLILDAGPGYATRLQSSETTTIEINDTGVGVFNTAPVAQQSKQADLNVGVSGLEDTQTFCNTLQERLAAYGWFT